MLKNLQRFFSSHKGSIIGIDIGTDSIKLAEVSTTDYQPVLLCAGILPLPGNLMDDGRIVDSDTLTALIRQLVSTSGASSREAVIGIGGRIIFAREVLFPVMDNEELKEAIKWDMDKYVPFEPDSFYYDFAVIGKAKNEMEMKVLLVAAPRDVIDSIVTVVKAAGLRPIAVDIEPLALYRTLESASNSMVIDLGSQLSQVTVFQQGSPAVTRTIPLGGRRFTEAIMHCLELEYSEAERLKQRQMGLLQRIDWSAESTALHRQLELVVDEVVREVRRTAEYYQIQNRDAMLDKVFLSGGGAKLDNLAQHISSQLDIPVLIHQNMRTLKYASSIDKVHLDNLFPQLAIAIGLALRGGDDL